jgi:hypothetical protein
MPKRTPVSLARARDGKFSAYEEDLALMNTPEVARRWNFLMNRSLESFASSFQKAEIVGFLTSAEHEDLVPCLIQRLRTTPSAQSPNTRATPGLEVVHQRCVRALATRLDAPPRAKDDWSLRTPVRCSCNLCR